MRTLEGELQRLANVAQDITTSPADEQRRRLATLGRRLNEVGAAVRGWYPIPDPEGEAAAAPSSGITDEERVRTLLGKIGRRIANPDEPAWVLLVDAYDMVEEMAVKLGWLIPSAAPPRARPTWSRPKGKGRG